MVYTESYNRHFITVDNCGRIVDGFSDAFRSPSDADICVNEYGGYQFRFFPGGVENPVLFDREHNIPLYKYETGKIVARASEEIAADIAALAELKTEPTQLDLIEAQVVYTAMMTDTLLE